MENNLDSQLVSQALNFHGQQLSRFLEEEAGDALKDLGMKDVDYHLYHKRIKELSFQDRSLRLRLHHFIGKKALFLFQKHSLSYFSSKAFDKGCEDYYAIMPPIETFMGVPSNDRRNQFWELVKPGDLVICSVKNNLIKGITVKVLAFDAGKNLEIWDLGIKGFIPSCNVPYLEEEPYKALQFNDTIRCEVVSCSNVSLVLSLIPRLSSTEIQYQYKLGRISTSDFPLSYKASKASKHETYNSLLEGSCSFHNPNNVMYLSNQFGLTLEENKMSSLFNCCQETYRKSDCSVMLKRKQGAKWALRNVADGIAYFKKGNMTEAFQCLNQALKFDPENVEALVARGALSANGGAFSKAVEDFELALKINPNHQNAKKYMGETLLAVGKRYEDEKNVDEALKTYHLCLEHIPGHKEAMEFIAAIKQSKSQDDLLMLTDIKVNDPEVKEKIRQLLKESTKKKTKTGKSKKKKKKYSSSSSASSSTSSEDSDDSSNTKLKRKRSNSKPEEIKEQSLSPLSKRMGMLERGHNVSGYPQCETLSGPVTSSHDFKLLAPMGQKLRSSEDLEYEEKVRKFLEQTMTKSEDKVENLNIVITKYDLSPEIPYLKSKVLFSLYG